MLITRVSPMTGKETTMDLPIDKEDLEQWMGGGLIQRVMPQLNDDQREFLMTGLLPDEWNYIMKGGNE